MMNRIMHLPHLRVRFGALEFARIGRQIVQVRKLVPFTRWYWVFWS